MIETNKYLEALLNQAETLGWFFCLTRDGYKLEKPGRFSVRFSTEPESYAIADEMLRKIRSWLVAYDTAISNALEADFALEPAKLKADLQMYTDAVVIATELKVLLDALEPIIERDPRI